MNNLLLFQFLYLTLQKIGFTSAIEASFIAFGLHYLCKLLHDYRAVGHYGICWMTSYF